MSKDIYQERYTSHQKRKASSLTSNYGKSKFKIYSEKEKKTLNEIMTNRSSQRIFNGESIDINPILEAIEKAPSSCDRKGVYVYIIENRHDKEILSGLLVGGVGWCHRADKILLIVANKKAYKSPAEKDFMHYLDAGVIIQTVYLSAEVNNIGCCFVNPNIREENKQFFNERFLDEDEVFCGALILGKYEKKH